MRKNLFPVGRSSHYPVGLKTSPGTRASGASRLGHTIMRLFLACALACSALILAVKPAYADIRIQIRVTDCTNNVAIGSAEVIVTTAKKGSKIQAFTNAKGYAELFPVRPDNMVHTVQVSRADYKSASISQSMGANSTVEIDLCLWPKTGTPTPTSPVAPAPTSITTPITGVTVTPTPTTTITTTVTATPTLGPFYCPGFGHCNSTNYPTSGQIDPAQAESCLSLITETVIGVLPIERSEGIDSALVQAREKLSACQADPACVTHNALMEAFSLVMKAIPKGATSELPAGLIVIPIYNIITDPQGLESCTQIGPVYWDMTRILSQEVQRVDALSVHPPANVLVYDPEGRQTGFLEDGSAVEEMPGVKSGVTEGARFILIPPGSAVKAQIKGSGEGMINFDLLSNQGDAVRDLSYQNIQTGSQTLAEVDLLESQPSMSLDSQGSGAFEAISPSRIQEHPIHPEILQPPTESTPAKVVEAPGSQGTQITTPGPSSTTSIQDNLPTILLILAGVALLVIGALGFALLALRGKNS